MNWAAPQAVPLGRLRKHLRLAQGFVVGGSPGVVLLDSATCCHDHACDESKDPTNDCGGKTKLHDGKRSGRRIDMEPNDQSNDGPEPAYRGCANRSPPCNLRQAA
jgi:hypothetical protein